MAFSTSLFDAIYQTHERICQPAPIVPFLSVWSAPPLPISHEPFLLPSKPLASHLLSVFFQHHTDTLYFVNQGRMQHHLNDLYARAVGRVVQPTGLRESYLLVRTFAVLALGAMHVETAGTIEDASEGGGGGVGVRDDELIAGLPGMAYFAKANALLPRFPDFRSLNAVQALAIMVRLTALDLRHAVSRPAGVLLDVHELL